jgi:hypothetical protein
MDVISVIDEIESAAARAFAIAPRTTDSASVEMESDVALAYCAALDAASLTDEIESGMDRAKLIDPRIAVSTRDPMESAADRNAA